jgi:hypothetical protein
MSDEVDCDLAREMLSSVVEFFDEKQGELGTVKFYEMLSAKLSRVARREQPWTWRYAQGVHRGTIKPSKAFADAVLALGAALDEVSGAALAYTVEVRVYARPGAVQNNSLVLGESKMCARSGCRVSFVPNVPWRKYCSADCGAMAMEEMRR